MMKAIGVAVGALLLATTPALAERAVWHEATCDHFIIVGQANETALRAYSEKLERFDAALRALSGIAQDGSTLNKLTVVALPSMMAVAGLEGSRYSDVAGFYLPRAAGSMAVVPLSTPQQLRDYKFTPETVMLHEYAHHFFFRNFSGAFPRWFIEGYAEAVSAARFEADGAVSIGLDQPARRLSLLSNQTEPQIGSHIARSVGQASLFDPDADKKITNAVFYARAWQLSHFLLFDPRRQKQFTSYLALLDKGTPGLNAATTAFGDLKRLQLDAQTQYGSGQIAALRIAPDRIRLGPISVRALSTAQAAVLPVWIRSLRGVTSKTAPAAYADATEAAKPFPNDPAAQNALAEAAIDAGAFDVADAAADRALKTDPQSTTALLHKAETAQMRADQAKDAKAWPQIRRWVVAANRSNPDAAEPLLLFYRSFLGEGSMPSAAAVHGLQRAAVIAPESAGIRVTLAGYYLSVGQVDDARALLGPVAYTPHGSAYQPLALDVIGKLGTTAPAQLSKQIGAVMSAVPWNSGD